ncbi:MAG: YybH family protein [Candidatus Binatia bacterium]
MGTAHNVASAIRAANAKFMETLKRGDAAGVAALYTATGQLLPAHSEFVTGPEAILNFWKAAMDMGVKEATLETLEVEDHGDTAIEVGRYRMMVEGGQLADAGKYVVVWKNVGGAWKLHWDIWTTSQPLS